jgi:hypothetical protein
MNDQIDFTVARDNLYREDSITDLKSASIRCLTPVKSDGAIDGSRKKIFVGHTQLMSPQGMVPLQAKLEASTLEEAMDKFPAAMQKAMDEMIENVRRMHQEQERMRKGNESRIIVPGR